MLGAAHHFAVDGCFIQTTAQQLNHLIDEQLSIQPLLVQQTRNMLVVVGLEVAEREVFQLPLDMADAQPVCQRRVDIEYFARHQVAFLAVAVLDAAYGAGALGDLDQCHAHVIDHRDQHFADVVHLSDTGTEHGIIGARVLAAADRGHLQHAINQPGNGVAEAFTNGFERQLALAYRAVEDRRDQGFLVLLQFRQDLRHLQPGTETADGILCPVIIRIGNGCAGLLGQQTRLPDLFDIADLNLLLQTQQPEIQVYRAVFPYRMIFSNLHHGLSHSCLASGDDC